MKKLTLILFPILFICTQLHSSELPKELKDIDSFIEKTMEQWNVPDVAVSIVEDVTTILSKSYGIKEIGKNAEFQKVVEDE